LRHKYWLVFFTAFKHGGGVPQKTQRVRKVQNGPPYLSSKTYLRWKAGGRIWSSSPPFSAKHVSGGQQEEGHGVVHNVQ